MPEYENTNRFTLFKNNRKEKKEHPDMTGTLNINGVDHWISGWKKQDKNGDTFISGAIRPKDSTANKAAVSVPEDFSDQIPFARHDF